MHMTTKAPATDWPPYIEGGLYWPPLYWPLSYWPPLCGRGLPWAIRPIGPTYIAYDGHSIYTVYDGGISVAYVYIFHIDIGKLSCAIDAMPKDNRQCMARGLWHC